MGYKKPRVRTNIALEMTVLEQARTLCERQFRSLSQTIEMLLVDYIAREAAEPGDELESAAPGAPTVAS